MRTIGLLGGMSFESTITYYRLINEGVQAAMGGVSSAKIILYSVNFGEIEGFLRKGDWQAITTELVSVSKRLAHAGADFLIICTNTMHNVANKISAAIDIPLLHIADATAEHVKSQRIDTVGLIGTRFTMTEPFYKDRLTQTHGIQVIVPESADQALIDHVIFDELCKGRIKDASRKQYLRIIDLLAARGARGVILGCTEISLLVTPEDTAVRLFDTTSIHAEQAVRWALTALDKD